MSLLKFMGLEEPIYGNYAKGILYVICEIFWKVMHAVGEFIDVVTGIFYKLAGSQYLGSGSETLVEEQDLLSQLFNQNIVSDLSLFMLLIASSLMVMFGVGAIVKQLYFSKVEKRSMADVIKNMVLGFIFLVCLTPLSMFAISSISTISSAIIGIFGDTTNVSLADLLFNASFSGDAVAAYNQVYETEITSWTQMENNFVFDLIYGGAEVDINFYWYLYLLGGTVVLYNLIVMVLRLVRRIFMVIILYITAPVYVARMVDDGGAKFKEWKNKAVGELISVVGTIISFMVLVSLIGVISDLQIIEIVENAATPVSFAATNIMPLAETVEPSETVVNSTAALINNATKIFLVMAGASVAKDSGELLSDVFKSANEESSSMLEGIFNRLGPKETSTTKTESSTPRTRVITRTSSSTRKVINYTEALPSSSTERSSGPTITNNNRNTFNNNISNINRQTTNIQNRANVNVTDSGTKPSTEGIKSANFRDSTGENNKVTDALNREFINEIRGENKKIRNEWEFVKGGNTTSSNQVVKEFEHASNELNSSIATGEQSKIKQSMNKYAEAYRKEEKVAKEGYREFAGKSSKLTNDLSAKQQQELKKISSAYHKAQVDYSKTARKLNEVSQGNMSASDALRIKERADKQREKLMDASSRASQFYNNQKRGE